MMKIRHDERRICMIIYSRYNRRLALEKSLKQNLHGEMKRISY